MNFNVHRRNHSFTLQPGPPDRREARSLKKMNQQHSLDPLLAEAKQIYQSQGDLKLAVALFQQFLETNPKHSEALYLCAVSELKLGHSESALSHLLSIASEYHNKPNAMLLSAMALNKLGRVTESLDIVNQCIQRYQHFEEAICFRGKLYLAQKYYHRAEQDFKSLVSQPNASFLAYHSLGDCYKAQGKPDRALTPYLKGLELLGSQEGTQGLRHEMELKVGICLYQLERWQQSLVYWQEIGRKEAEKGCEYYYYLGGCEIKLDKRQVGLLHLEYCLRIQGNTTLMKKSYKKLIELYLENYQFYEALNVVKLGDICGIRVEGWANVVEAFMLVIKGHYEDGVDILTKVANEVKRNEGEKRLQKIKRESSHLKSRYNQTSEIRRGMVLGGLAKAKDKDKDKESQPGKLRYFSTKSVAKAVPKIESTRVRTRVTISSKKDDLRVQTEHVEREQLPELYLPREKEFLYPFVLVFKAYGQFFMDNFFACLDTYEEYQTYIKDIFGRNSDVAYNKTLCEGLLMTENGLLEEALTKYSLCVDLYHEKHHSIPCEPLLYRVVLLTKLALQQAGKMDNEEEKTSQDILESTIELIDSYKEVFEVNSLALYFKGMICLLLGRAEECREWLDQGLKVAEDCSWKWLWIKGVVEVQLGNYYEAVKEFSAGLILESRPQLYLGRSISFLLLSERKIKSGEGSASRLMQSVHLKEKDEQQDNSKDSKTKNDILVENCFQDLQKYIELESKQDDISLWVSKILFCNGAYDEAIRSLNKIEDKTKEVVAMNEAVAIYEGEFGDGGDAGVTIRTAFEGKLLTPEQEAGLLHEKRSLSSDGDCLGKQFQKWLIILHLYVRQDYSLLLKFLQRELFESQEGATQVLLRYNVAVLYLLLEEPGKSLKALKTLIAKNEKCGVSATMAKLQQLNFDQDECLEGLREEVGINCSKLLSNYLPFRSINLQNNHKSVRIFVRPSIPFPDFPKPSLQLEITLPFIQQEISINSVQKRLEAPWIRRTSKRTVQFTQKLQESEVEWGETGSLKGTSQNRQPFI